MSRRPAHSGASRQALGRTRGGFGTKIHLKSNTDGLPITFDVTDGEASGSLRFETLIELGPDTQPRPAVAD